MMASIASAVLPVQRSPMIEFALATAKRNVGVDCHHARLHRFGHFFRDNGRGIAFDRIVALGDEQGQSASIGRPSG